MASFSMFGDSSTTTDSDIILAGSSSSSASAAASAAGSSSSAAGAVPTPSTTLPNRLIDDTSDSDNDNKLSFSMAAPSYSSVVGAMACAPSAVPSSSPSSLSMGEADRPSSGWRIRERPILDPKWSMREKGVRIIQQFLHDNGFRSALAALEDDTKLSYSGDHVGAPNVLLSAITRYEEGLVEHVKADVSTVDDYLRARGDSKEAAVNQSDIQIPLHVGNIIAVKFAAVKAGTDSKIIATGSVDQTVRITDWTNQTVIRTVDCKAPVLSLDFHPTLPSVVLAGCMNGSAHIINYESTIAIQQSFKNHSKWVVAAKWNIDGSYFATASADNSLRIYRHTVAAVAPTNDDTSSASALGTWNSVHEVVYKGEVTAIDWVKSKNILLVAVRDDNYLHEIDMTTLRETNKYNMNLKSWDDHVSFTVLDLAVSNDDRMVLASTDKSRIIMFEVGTSTQVRNFYGANNGEYANPRVIWSLNGKYVYSTTEDMQLATFDVSSGRLLSTMKASDKIVRGIAQHPTLPIVATVAYDRLVKLWSSSSITSGTTINADTTTTTAS